MWADLFLVNELPPLSREMLIEMLSRGIIEQSAAVSIGPMIDEGEEKGLNAEKRM